MIEKIIADLHKMFVFKDTTSIGDIVLIVADKAELSSLPDFMPFRVQTKLMPFGYKIVYAMVTGIERDYTRKEEWWQVSLQLLTIPPQKTIWTLRTPQFTGQEIFTMGGEPRFFKAIDFGEKDETADKKNGAPFDLAMKKKPFLKLIK